MTIKLSLLEFVPQLSDIVGMVTSILNTRELSKDTAQVLRDLPKSGPRLITRGGEVVGILIPPSGQGIESDIDLMARLRMAQAFAASQHEAVLNGRDELSMKEIDQEIQAARKERRTKSKRRSR